MQVRRRQRRQLHDTLCACGNKMGTMITTLRGGTVDDSNNRPEWMLKEEGGRRNEERGNVTADGGCFPALDQCTRKVGRRSYRVSSTHNRKDGNYPLLDLGTWYFEAISSLRGTSLLRVGEAEAERCDLSYSTEDGMLW